MPPVGPDAVLADSRVRVRAGLLSLVVAIVLLAAKYQAYRMTGSTAILSDALESIVNVVAAVFALGGIAFAGPARRPESSRTATGRSSSSRPPSRAASSPSPPCSSSTR